MKGAIPFRIPVESFVILSGEKSSHQLRVIYFDPKGRRNEVFVRKSTLDFALSKIDGKPKAIARSTGGLVVAQPYQLVLYHCLQDSVSAGPEFRIKVRFKDFARTESEKMTTGSVMTMTKSLLPEEIQDPIRFSLQEPQKYLLDLGQGVIPICVFSFISEPGGESVALFVETDVMERSIRENGGSKIPVQRYRVPKELIRVAPDMGKGAHDYDAARKNYERLKRLDTEIVPEAFQVGPTMELPTGGTYQDILEQLRRSTHRWNRQDDEDETSIESHLIDDGCVTSDFLMYMEPA
jgi:hypothetical protein